MRTTVMFIALVASRFAVANTSDGEGVCYQVNDPKTNEVSFCHDLGGKRRCFSGVAGCDHDARVKAKEAAKAAPGR